MVENNILDKKLQRHLEQLELDNVRIKELFKARIHLYDNYYLLQPTSLQDLVYLLCKYSDFDNEAIRLAVVASESPIIAEIPTDTIKGLMKPEFIRRELKKILDLIGG